MGDPRQVLHIGSQTSQESVLVIVIFAGQDALQDA